MIVFRSPKGWTGPKEVDGKQVEGSFRAHQVPISMDKPEHLVQLEEWLRSYHPEELFDDNGTPTVMLNPVILRRTEPYTAEEGCLSLTGKRTARRWRSIKVQWQNERLQTRVRTFTGWTAQIIQHEIDHCDGVLI